MDIENIKQELKFKAVRSSGPGGMHVNKVATKVELSFDVHNSKGLSPAQRYRVSQKLASRLTKEGILLLQCDESRSQHKNRALVVKRFLQVMTEALKVEKRRKKTKPKRSAIEKRLRNKKRAGEKKANRGKPNFD